MPENNAHRRNRIGRSRITGGRLRLVSRLLVPALALALPAAAIASSHEVPKPTKEWDAHAVERLLDQLTKETRALQTGVGKHLEEAEEGSPRRIVLHDVYEIHHRVISLESAVRNGQSREQTEPIFRRLLDGVRNARRDAQAFPEIEAMRSHIDKADAELLELEAYYGVWE